MKILCAVDFGVRTQASARVARDLARRTSGTVELVHVVPMRATGVLAEAVDAAVLDDSVREDGRTRLEVLGREMAAAGVPVTTHLAEGDVERELMKRAGAIGADLVVMGAHGRPALERLVLGSASERTVRIADRPVLIVPAGVEPSATPGGDGVGRPLRVLVALDGRVASDGALEFVRGLRRHTACDVTILRLVLAARRDCSARAAGHPRSLRARSRHRRRPRENAPLAGGGAARAGNDRDSRSSRPGASRPRACWPPRTWPPPTFW